LDRETWVSGYRETPNYGTGGIDLKARHSSRKVLAIIKYE